MLETVAWLVVAILFGYALRCAWMAWRLWQEERRESEQEPRGRWRTR
jgi:hypothetical protein